MPNLQITKEQARTKIETLISEYKTLKRSDKLYFERMSETDVVNKFVTPLLDALGWPIRGSEFRQEVHTAVGRPDIRAEYAEQTYIYVEAKRFGVIDMLEEAKNTLSGVVTPGQMQLPGMPNDRTKQEQQAINYAFANNGTWAILTNFERFRLFNARRDWLVFSIENPDGYLEENFEYLWQLAWHNIQSGSLDRLNNQRARADVDDDYLDFINEWRLKLAQNIVTRPDSNGWAFHPDGTVKLHLLRSVVQRILDRLVLVRYAEDHLVARPGTLHKMLEGAEENIYAIPFNEQLQRLYRNFDRLHNSALFAEGDADRADVSSELLGALVVKLYEARFRAMTPDIMGNTYEQYLGKALVVDAAGVHARDNLETRKKQGSYYTPQVIVRYIVDSSLGRFLYGDQPPLNPPHEGGDSSPPFGGDGRGGEKIEQRKTWEEIAGLRLIDPACGSGAFLVYAYQVLADFYRGEIRRLEREEKARYEELVAAGITTPMELRMELTHFQATIKKLQAYPRIIVERHIYGVDLDPQAAEIATVNLIMRAMADQQRYGEQRLPLILNQNVKVGNALIGTAGNDPVRYEGMAADLAQLRQLRLRLIDEADGHDVILAEIEAVTARLGGVLEGEIAPHFDALDAWREQVRPFHWAVEFPEIFVDEAGESLGENSGFTIVVGNPPWEIVKPDLREYYAQFDPLIESKLTRKKAEARIAELDTADPNRLAEWTAQKARISATATYFKKSADYTRQGRGDTATHKLFVERGYMLLGNGGRLGYVIPSGIYSDLGTKQLRQMLLNEGKINHLFNFSNERFFFSDVHHSFKFTLIGTQKGEQSDSFWATFRFNPRVAVSPEDFDDFIADSSNRILVSVQSLKRFSPTSLSLMEFPSQSDADIADKLYGTHPLFGEDLTDSWNAEFGQDFHITNDRHLFNTDKIGLPMYEGKTINQFNPYHGEIQYWVDEQKGQEKLSKKRSNGWYHDCRIAFREIARSTDSRTAIAAMLPPNSFTTITLWTVKTDSQPSNLYLLALLNSFCIDYLARFRVGTHMTLFLTKQLPVPRLAEGDAVFDAIVLRAAALTCTTAVFAELWESVMGTPWVADERQVDDDERQRLRDELDGIIAHLYGLSRDDFAHILNTFPLVFPDTEAGAAKKAALLTMYDHVAP